MTCGNGILQGTEVCDDGNLSAGDGCFDCMPEGGGGSSTGMSDEIGTDDGRGEAPPSDGCECGIWPDSRGWSGPIALGLLFGIRRRRE